MKRPLIGEVLISENAVTAEELAKAMEIQRKNGALLGVILMGSGAINGDTLDACLKIQAKRALDIS